MRVILLASVMVALGLSGCGVFKSKSKDNVAEPTELVDLKSESVTFSRVWSTSLSGDKAERGERLGPIVIGERIYAAGTDGEVRALDAVTGKQIWQRELEVRWSGGVGADQKRVVMGGLDGEVAALDATDGELLWQIQVSSEVLAAPAVTEKVVVLRSNDGRVHGLAVADGKVLWVVDRSVPLLTVRGAAAPVVVGDVAYVPADNGKLTAINVADGKVLWEKAFSTPDGRNELERLSDIDGQVQVLDGDLFLSGYNGQTLAVTAQTGETLWTFKAPSAVGVAVAKNKVLVTDSESHVIALDRRTGAQLWRQDGLLNRLASAPALFGDYLVVGDLEGYLHAINLEDGALVGRTRLDKLPFPRAPVMANEMVYAQSASGDLAAYRLTTR